MLEKCILIESYYKLFNFPIKEIETNARQKIIILNEFQSTTFNLTTEFTKCFHLTDR